MIDNSKPQRIASAAGGDMIGGIAGAMLASLGHATSSSPIGVGITIAVAMLFGACLARTSGAIIGAIYGALFSAFGWAIGGSMLGVVLTILASALVGGWINWVNGAAEEKSTVPRRSFRFRPAKVVSVHLLDNRKKELMLWN
jgi:hypothetical protein